MTSTPIPAAAPVRLHDHWRGPFRAEAGDAFTLRRAAKAVRAAGYSVTVPGPADTHTFWCEDVLDTRGLQCVLIEAGIPAVIATATRPTPAEEAVDETAWQEAEAQAYVESEAQHPTPDPWAPF